MATSFFYVKAGGSALGATEDNDDGIYSAAKTGSWSTAFSAASQYFDTLADARAASHTMVAGDVVCISSSGTDIATADVEVLFDGGVYVLTVDDDNVDQYVKATAVQLEASASGYYEFMGDQSETLTVVFHGINSDQKQHAYFNKRGSFQRFIDCSWGTINHQFNLNQEWGTHEFINCTWTGGGNIQFRNNFYTFIGGEISLGNDPAQFINTYLNTVSYDGVDLSGQTNTSIYHGPTTALSVSDAYYNASKLPPNWTFSNVTDNAGNALAVESCDSAYQYVQESKAGTIEFVEDVYYTSHDTLDDGTTKGSLEYETSADASATDYLRFAQIANRATKCISAINTEAATKKKVRVRMAVGSGDSITKQDLVFYVAAPKSSAPYQADWLYIFEPPTASGTALSTETGNWTGAGLGTQYYIDIDMGTPGNGRVRVIPCVCKPNVTVYFSWQLEFVA